MLDELGHDPRSAYAERFWLSVVGPSSLLLLRRLAADLEAQPEGFDLPIEPTARGLGLSGKNGRNSPMLRTIGRCCQFRLAHLDLHEGVLLTRRKQPSLTSGQIARLPDDLRDAHRAWQVDHERDPSRDDLYDHARRLALSLFELGEHIEDVELHLRRLRFHPVVASHATGWAWQRNREAKAAAEAAALDL